MGIKYYLKQIGLNKINEDVRIEESENKKNVSSEIRCEQKVIQHINYQMNSTPVISPTLHSPTTDSFDELQRLIELGAVKGNMVSTKQSLLNILELGISHIAKKELDSFTSIAKQFAASLTESKHVYIHHQVLLDNFQDLKLMVCKHNKVYQLGKPGAELKGYVLIGKAVSVHKRKKKQDDHENSQAKEQLTHLIEQGIIRLVEDDKYYLPKHEKHFEIQDILLQHDMPDASVDEVYLGNQLYNSFVPIEKSIVLIVPAKAMKPECLNFIKSSLLHTYIDEANLLSRIFTKQLFYKNSILKGIFFIDEGEVEVKSGRIIARGWTTYGKCKTSGFGWKFRPIPFIRFVIKNSAIWKQFYNDICLNTQYPFNIIHILSLNDDEDFTSSAQWRSLGRKKIGGKSPKLPKLNAGRSVDESKLEEIEKLRHYDERLNNVFEYKQDLLTRKLKGIIHGKFEPIFRDERSEQKLEKKKKLIMLRLNSKASVLSKKQPSMETQPDNILIMSVLKRLESIADLNEPVTRRQYSISHGVKESGNFRKRENVKILPMQLHERTKELKRMKRY